MSCEGLCIGLSLGAHLCCDNDVDDMGLSQYGVVNMAIKVPQFFVHEGAPKASGFIPSQKSVGTGRYPHISVDKSTGACQQLIMAHSIFNSLTAMGVHG